MPRIDSLFPALKPAISLQLLRPLIKAYPKSILLLGKVRSVYSLIEIDIVEASAGLFSRRWIFWDTRYEHIPKLYPR
jgi:hypothetical protein